MKGPKTTAGVAAEDGGGPHPDPDVIIVGAGVSGCACAAALASAGLKVTLMNSAMDRVGLPAYGPDLVGGDGGWSLPQDCLDSLPKPLRDVWLGAATAPAGGEPVLNIDRRRISIETKRILEQVPGLQFRQGFVTDLRLLEQGPPAGGVLEDQNMNERSKPAGRSSLHRAQVETIFGEVFEAEIVVVAVGLSLGGSVVSGAEATPGGRYGEPSSDGLRGALERLGAEFCETHLDVGARISRRVAAEQGWISSASHTSSASWASSASSASYISDADSGDERVIRGDALEEVLVPALNEYPSVVWSAEFPPAPHWQVDLRLDRMVLERRVGEHMGSAPTHGSGATSLPALSPDGAATAEMYASPTGPFAEESAATGEDAGPIAGRMPLSVRAMTVAGLADAGRMQVGGEPAPVWIVGRAAGAPDYASSLASGVRAASDIVSVLTGRRIGEGRERGDGR
jgi:hypothetical protein